MLVLGLLTRAWLRFLTGARTGSESAQADLDEAWEIAERGPMRLFMADILLTRARLFGNRKAESGTLRSEMAVGEGGANRKADAPYPWATAVNPKGEIVHNRTAKHDLEDAEYWIHKCGYHRRDEELADAKRAILGA